MEDNLNNSVFTSLKPICDRLMLNVNQQSISELMQLLDSLSPMAIKKFQDYICFPIEIQLHQTSKSQQKQMLVHCLAKLLGLIHIDSVKVFLRLNTLLIQQVISTNDQIKVAEVSEELKLGVVNCLTVLWGSAGADTLYDMYSRDRYPQLSPVVFMLVQLARSEKLIKLRVAALECLQILCYVHNSADAADVVMRHRAQNVVMLMLPGIVSCNVSIASEPSSQNHKVTVANIQLWSRVVCLVMEDGEPEAPRPELPGHLVTSGGGSAVERVQQLQRQLRTADWLLFTAERLTAVTEALIHTQTHTHWQVRHTLAEASHSLLTTCSKNMAPSVGSLVCCLIALSEDDMAEVRSTASRALADVSSMFDRDSDQLLLELVEAAFYSLLSRAPRIMQGTDENSQLTCMRLLVGYLRLQGPKLAQILSSSSFLHRLLVTMFHISRLDTSHISLLEECSIRQVESEGLVTEPLKRLMYCNSTQKLHKLQDVCNVLREHADVHTITHTLIDLLDSSSEHTKEIILLLNYTLTGGGANSITDQAELVESVVSVYLQPRLMNLPFSVTQSGNAIAASTTSEAQNNIVQVSLIAEGLGLLALAVGGKHFSPCLLRCLYPLLECAGSSLHPIASAGLAAIQNVASACVGGGVTELVRANVDYLSHHITMRLRRAHHSPGVLSVLSVVMRHTTLQVLPSLQEIIEDVLVQSCDAFQEYNASGFLRVFLTFLKCLRGWQGEEADPTLPPQQQQKSILQQMLEYKRCQQAAENFDDNESIDGDTNEEMFATDERIKEDEDMEQESEPKVPSPSVKLTVAVLERSLHFLPSKHEQRQILVLDILREGVLLLQSEEDQLLPVVHKIWSPLINRFQSSITKPLVMHRAFLLLCTLGNVSRDFIRSRTLKQVLPGVCRTLHDSSAHSLLKDSGSGYRLTQQFKLQRALLAGLGRLATDLALPERELHSILQAASPYLSSRQPAPLQELCQQLYKQVASVHSDLVWLQLVSVWYPASKIVSPSPDDAALQLDTCCDVTSEFKKNVAELLQTLEFRQQDS